MCLYYSRCVAPPGKQLSPDSSLRSHTVVPFCICWLEVRKPKARFLLGLCGLSPPPASSPQWCMVPKTAKMMEIVTNSLVNMQVIFSFLLLLERWHYKFANSFFFPRQWKQNYLLKSVWSCQNPAEQPPTSGIQTAANAGSKKAIILLFPADKVMLIKA